MVNPSFTSILRPITYLKILQEDRKDRQSHAFGRHVSQQCLCSSPPPIRQWSDPQTKANPLNSHNDLVRWALSSSLCHGRGHGGAQRLAKGLAKVRQLVSVHSQDSRQAALRQCPVGFTTVPWGSLGRQSVLHKCTREGRTGAGVLDAHWGGMLRGPLTL